jgi:hypothetical protein
MNEQELREFRELAIAACDVFLWRISIGGGYGDFRYIGTPEEAEERRYTKALWEGAVGRKQKLNLITAEINPEYYCRYIEEGAFDGGAYT